MMTMFVVQPLGLPRSAKYKTSKVLYSIRCVDVYSPKEISIRLILWELVELKKHSMEGKQMGRKILQTVGSTDVEANFGMA